MNTDRIDRWKTAPAAMIGVLWVTGVVQAGYSAWVIAQCTPSWMTAMQGTTSLKEFGWQGAATTAVLAICFAATLLWGLLASKAHDTLKIRL